MNKVSTRPKTIPEDMALSLVESVADGLYALDEKGRFVVFNDACERYFGRARESVLGRVLIDVFPQTKGTDFEKALEKAMSQGVAQRVEARSPLTGTTILFRVFPSKQGVTVLFTDLGERSPVEPTLSASESRYQTLFDSLEEGFCIVEVLFDESFQAYDYRFLEANPAFTQQTGLSHAVGRTIRELVPKHEEHWIQSFGDVALTGKPDHFENSAAHLDGRWYEVSAFRVGKDGDRQVGILFNDATERHRLEIERQKTNLLLESRVAQRTEELQAAIREMESFNYSVSHDLRAPLRNIAGMASILLEEAGPELSAEHRKLLDRQMVNVQRMGNLMEDLLQLSRLSRAEISRFSLDMTAKAREAVETLEVVRPEGITVDIQEGMRGDADPNLIRAVFHCLIGNAIKFSPHGGTIRVTQFDGVFAISDQGVGFDMDHAGRIFLPFERLVRDAEFSGTGIGLAKVDRIVRRHGGRVWAEAAPGKGATFSFTLEPAPSHAVVV